MNRLFSAGLSANKLLSTEDMVPSHAITPSPRNCLIASICFSSLPLLLFFALFCANAPPLPSSRTNRKSLFDRISRSLLTQGIAANPLYESMAPRKLLQTDNPIVLLDVELSARSIDDFRW